MSSAADGELQRKIEEYRARERVYLAGLLGQEAEMGQLRQMAADVLSAYGDVSKAATRGALVSPTANMEVLLLRQKLREKDQQVTLLKEELEANRFDQRLPAGQDLMRKCKSLLTENRELGEEIREERIAELRAALQVEQRQNGQLYQKVQEASDFCKELVEENEKLQGTIARVAGKLGESRAELETLVKERAEAKKKRKLDRDAKVAAAAAAAAAAAHSSSSLTAAPTATAAAAACGGGSCGMTGSLAAGESFPAGSSEAQAASASALVSSPLNGCSGVAVTTGVATACASPVVPSPMQVAVQGTPTSAPKLPMPPLPSPIQHQVFIVQEPTGSADATGGHRKPTNKERKRDKKDKGKKRKSDRGSAAVTKEEVADA